MYCYFNVYKYKDVFKVILHERISNSYKIIFHIITVYLVRVHFYLGKLKYFSFIYNNKKIFLLSYSINLVIFLDNRAILKKI